MKDEDTLSRGRRRCLDAEDSFKYAAEMTGGDYIITQDINEVTAKLKELEKYLEGPKIEVPTGFAEGFALAVEVYFG